jgi:hypothetical protein
VEDCHRARGEAAVESNRIESILILPAAMKERETYGANIQQQSGGFSNRFDAMWIALLLLMICVFERIILSTIGIL